MDLEQWFYSLRLRVRAFFHPNQVDEEMKEELREHLEEPIKENVARGMSPEQARYSALHTLGGITQIEQQCRDARGGSFLEDFVQDLRYGFRARGLNCFHGRTSSICGGVAHYARNP